jgi:glycosyltransferase involved in cell wall biosynthesis
MKVSLIIATHERPGLLRRALASVARQSFPDIETIVVDDNGLGTHQQQQTGNVVAEFGGMTYVANPKNIGKAASMNIAAKLAQGEIIAFLDDDDEFHPDKITQQVARLESTQAAGVYCNYERTFRGNLYYRSSLKRGKDEGDLALDMLLGKNEICGGSTLAIWRRAFHDAGGFNESFRRHVDWSFLLSFFRNHTLCLCEETLVTIHMPDNLWKISPEALFDAKQLLFSTYSEDIARHGEAALDIHFRHWMDVYSQSLRARKFGLAAKCLALSLQHGRMDVPRFARSTASALKHMTLKSRSRIG